MYQQSKDKLDKEKKNIEKQIEEMKHNEVMNDYEVYWDIVKNASQENMPLIANAMFNIIEYFFGFIEKADSLHNIFEQGEFKDNKYQSFKRYIDRESHSDRMNIHDYKDFNVDTFKKAFEMMFKSKSYEDHYKKYMGSKQ